MAFYLRGGPRAHEAATYWLQGRALAHGALSWTAPDPSASFRGHDLLFSAPDRVAGIFPPGYAVLLAPAFLVGAPMLVGPLLAAAIVTATWLLARELAESAGQDEAGAEGVARVAVGLSVLSAALRYHTADALPYGAAAVAVAMAVACALRARRLQNARLFGVAGLAVGTLLATHPVSAVTTGAVVAALAFGSRGKGRALGWGVVAVLPGALLLLAANRAALGHTLGSPAAAYASLVEPHGARSFSAAAAVAVQRLRAHLADVSNLEPLALLALVPLLRRTPGRNGGVAIAALVVAGQLVLALAVPFFSAPPEHAPGAGARLLVPVLPIEHALVALALARLVPRALAPAAMVTFALSLAGFAVHTSNDHEAIAAAGMGRPRYEPDVAREANVSHGLLFFDDDEGFELAFDPGVPASHGIQAVRLRGDDHDRLIYDSLGHPAIHKYVTTDGSGSGSATVTFWAPPAAGGDVWRFEAESDWPPVAAQGGHATVVEAPGASEGHALALEPAAGEATMTLSLPVPRGPTPAERKTWMVVPRVLQRGGKGAGTLEVVDAPGGPPLASWTWDDASAVPSATELTAQPVELGGDRVRAWLVVHARGGSVALDKTTLRPR